MKKLGNFLFGIVYFSVEFVKGDEDEGEVGVDDDDFIFFIMDRFGSNIVFVYKEDVDEDGNE